MRVRAFDDHVPCGVNIDARWVARVRLHEPNNDGDVIGDALVGHGDRSFGLEEVHGTTIVVGKRRRFGFKGRERGG